MKTLFPYYGSKTRLAEWVVAHMAPHAVYVEPFCGSAAVLLAKPPVAHEILGDADGELINFFTQLRDHTRDLARVCELTPYARAELAACRVDVDPTTLSDLERARRFWVRTTQAVNGAANGGWAVTTRRSMSRAVQTQRRISNFEAVAQRLARTSIDNRDALETIDRYDRPDAVIYCDPPYVRTTRAAGGDNYIVESDDAFHRELADRLRAASAQVLVSGYPCELYDELYDGWYRSDRTCDAPSATMGANSKERVESLWVNRPVEVQPSLFDAS